ncbi:MAG TPA: TIGR03118 family protein, partial [Candidatus Kapabacteria bacterium]
NSSTFWIADHASGRTSYYDLTGALRSSYIVGGGSPTGIVADTFSGTEFTIPTYGKAQYIFASLSGSLSALPSFYNSAIVTDSAHAASSSFTGLAAVSANGTVNLYAPNVKNGSLDVFDGLFNRVNQISGRYTGYTPFNAVVIDTLLYVSYARSSGNFVATGAGNGGYIDVYTLGGVWIKNFSSSAQLDEPWGMTLAPSDFGPYGGKLLVGNFGNGEITVFDPATGNYLGTVNGTGGAPLVIDGLWALESSNGTVYYTAGPNSGMDGVFGKITLQ